MIQKLTTPAPSVTYAVALKTGHFGFQYSPISSPGHLYLKVSEGICLRSLYSEGDLPEILIIHTQQIDEFLRLSMRCHLWSPMFLPSNNVSTCWQLTLRDQLMDALDLYWLFRDSPEKRKQFIGSADRRVLNWLSRYRRDHWPELLSVEPGTGRAI